MRLFGDVASRQFEDVDILVPESQFDDACQSLQEEGWERVLDWGYEASFRKGSIGIDLHRKTGSPDLGRSVPFEPLFEAAQPIRLATRSALTVSDADALILATQELLGDGLHRRARLQKVLDVATLAGRPINWEIVKSRAARFGATKQLSGGLSVADAFLGVPSAGLRDLPRPPKVTWNVVEQLTDGSVEPRTPSELQVFHFAFQTRPLDAALIGQGLRAGSRLLRPNEADFGIVRLPESLRPLYYGIRAGRIVAQRVRRSSRKN